MIIPTALEADGNTVKLNDTEVGVAFDLNKDESGKVQITLNGAAVGTGITLPGHAIADIEGLQAALDGKANSVHTHVHTDVTDFDTSVDSRIDAKLDDLPEVTIPEYTLKSGSAEGTVALYKDGSGSDTKVNGYDNLKAQVSGKYTKPSGGIPKSDLNSDIQASLDKIDSLPEVIIPEYILQPGSAEGTVALYKDGVGGDTKVNGYDSLKSQVNSKYSKPSGGIPKTDLASDVQASLGKADTALQTAPEYQLQRDNVTNGIKLQRDYVDHGTSIPFSKLMDIENTNIYNPLDTENTCILFIDAGTSLNTSQLDAPVIISQNDDSGYTDVTIKNPNLVTATLRTSTGSLGIISANRQSSFRLYGNTNLHFEATGYLDSAITAVTFTSLEPLDLDELISLSSTGDVREGYVGRTVSIKIDGNDVLFRVSDVNTYDLSDGSGKSHYTLEMVDILEKRRMNATKTNLGG